MKLTAKELKSLMFRYLQEDSPDIVELMSHCVAFHMGMSVSLQMYWEIQEK